ncbi:MAG: outer membrane protein assembly factor BamD [Candidatus Lloydbacteria bacterium]|nr:outer membrane protein assembly factor BamD [Candidatus Lloydbacteria bacterium]
MCIGCATAPPIVSEQMLDKSSLGELWKEADALGQGEFYEQERVVLNEIVSRISGHNMALFRIEKSLFLEARRDSQRETYGKVKKAFDDFYDSFSFKQDPWAYPATEEAIWILAVSYYKQINPPNRSQKEAHLFIETTEEKLFSHYPDTLYRKTAEKMLYRARRNLARHSFFIGDYYLRTWALTSAELRFKSILEDYPGFLGKQVHARLGHIERLKKHTTNLEQFQRWLLFKTFDADIDTAKKAQAERFAESSTRK